MQTKPQSPSDLSASPAAASDHAGDVLGPYARDITSISPVGELIQYCCFVVVAEELHFTRAARLLRMDQSVVSRHIQKLESSLGLKLFVRGDRKVELTAAGNAFVPFANRALIAAKAGVRLAQSIARGEPREFEVAYSPSVDIHLIAQIKEFVEASRPTVPVHFRSVAPDKLVERLLAGNSHAAIALLPVGEDVSATCVLREELLVVVPAEHRLAHRSRIAPSEIGDDPVVWIVGAIQPALTEHLFGLLRRAGYVPNVMQEAQTVAEALGLAREGMGITFIKISDRHLVGDGLVVRPLAKPVLVETGLLYLRERRWDFLTRFVSMVRTHFRCEKPGTGG
jgi:DNA-binding transcriptional LysR family regulator